MEHLENSRKNGNCNVDEKYSTPTGYCPSDQVEVNSECLSYRQEETNRHKSKSTIDGVPMVQAMLEPLPTLLET